MCWVSGNDGNYACSPCQGDCHLCSWSQLEHPENALRCGWVDASVPAFQNTQLRARLSDATGASWGGDRGIPCSKCPDYVKAVGLAGKALFGDKVGEQAAPTCFGNDIDAGRFGEACSLIGTDQLDPLVPELMMCLEKRCMPFAVGGSCGDVQSGWIQHEVPVDAACATQHCSPADLVCR